MSQIDKVQGPRVDIVFRSVTFVSLLASLAMVKKYYLRCLYHVVYRSKNWITAKLEL